jgi:hypothetical protein
MALWAQHAAAPSAATSMRPFLIVVIVHSFGSSGRLAESASASTILPDELLYRNQNTSKAGMARV